MEACQKIEAWPNFSMGNHDSPRVTTRFGKQLGSFAMNALLLMLPGTPLTYNGEEIGMLDNYANEMKCMTDKRDFCRSPFQWSKEKNAGM